MGSKGNVTLTCSGASIPPRDLTWKYSNGEEVDVNNTLGVIKLILDTESSLVLNMENFTSEATVSCGGEVEDKKPRQNFSICGEPCCRHNLFQLFVFFVHGIITL